MIWNPWKRLRHLEEDAVHINAVVQRQYDLMVKLIDDIDKARQALRAVAAEEKPTSNATVRRMAKMARESLK